MAMILNLLNTVELMWIEFSQSQPIQQKDSSRVGVDLIGIPWKPRRVGIFFIGFFIFIHKRCIG